MICIDFFSPGDWRRGDRARFVPLRKWVNQVDLSKHEMGAMNGSWIFLPARIYWRQWVRLPLDWFPRRRAPIDSPLAEQRTIAGSHNRTYPSKPLRISKGGRSNPFLPPIFFYKQHLKRLCINHRSPLRMMTIFQYDRRFLILLAISQDAMD